MSNSVLNDFLLYLQRNSPKSLQDRGVYCNISNDKKRISFTYEQALADPADEIASICRGIIVASYIDIDIDKPIVQPRYAAIPFMRFFNAGTPNAAIVGVSKTKVLDKLDGTMMILYYCDHKWRVATRSTPDATAQTFSGDTYAQLFWSLFDKNLLEHLSPTFTYTFELIGPSNRHLVIYDTDELILTNIFDIRNRVEINIFEMQHNCKLPKVVDFTTIEALEKELENKKVTDAEGYVIIDFTLNEYNRFNRLKVKNPAFFLPNNEIQLLYKSPRAAIAVVLNDTIDDMMASNIMHDNIKKAILDLQSRIIALCAKHDLEIEKIKKLNLTSKKDLALVINSLENSFLKSKAFKLISQNISMFELIKKEFQNKKLTKHCLNVLLSDCGGYYTRMK